MTDADPLALKDLDPRAIAAAVDAKKTKTKPLSELDIKKEERLAQKEQRLAAQTSSTKYPSGPAAKVQEAVKEDKQETIQSLLDKLGGYKERFPHLKSRNKVGAKSSVEEIEDEIHYYEVQLGSSNNSRLGMFVFLTGIKLVEEVNEKRWNPFGLKLKGLGNVAESNAEQLTDIIDELSIKYGLGMYMSPEMRLVCTVGAMMHTVHRVNSGDRALAEAMSKVSGNINVPKGAEEL